MISRQVFVQMRNYALYVISRQIFAGFGKQDDSRQRSREKAQWARIRIQVPDELEGQCKDHSQAALFVDQNLGAKSPRQRAFLDAKMAGVCAVGARDGEKKRQTVRLDVHARQEGADRWCFACMEASRARGEWVSWS
jgi:hypothetical protein